MTVVAGSLLATQELMEDCCCRILVGNGNQGADGGTNVAGSLLATQDLIDCKIPAGYPGADGGTSVAESLFATQDLIDNC
jgi:hypothetical protein